MLHRIKPAIGDGQRLAIAEEYNFVRAETVARMLTDFLVTQRDVVDADDAPCARNVVFGDIEQAAVTRECTVTIKMPAGISGKNLRRNRNQLSRRTELAPGAMGCEAFAM